jgi:predicted transcriptional regulator YdeE
MVACEVTDTKNIQEGSETGIIEAGEYAKFVLRGDVKNAVMEFWTALWEMDLDRKFACDFEEYQGGGEMTNAQIDVYISLNE